MNDPIELTQSPTRLSASEPADRRTSSTAQPKSVLGRKLLRRGKGATLAELQHATGWQTHSVRAFLSGLRKKGEVVVKEERKSGETAYRVGAGKVAAAAADA